MVLSEKWLTVPSVNRNGQNLDPDVGLRNEVAPAVMIEQACSR